MYKKCYLEKAGPNYFDVHLWEDEGYKRLKWENKAYVECPEEDHTHRGINDEPLKLTNNWRYSRNPKYSANNTHGLHFHDIKPHQKFLIERYGTDDRPSTTSKVLFFDIEIEIGGALTEEYIESAPMPVTSIAWWDKKADHWAILVTDTKSQLKHTKTGENKNKEIIPVANERELLAKFLEHFRDIDPDILVGYNSDYFDIPYLYYRMCKVLGEEWATQLSPLGIVKCKKGNDYWFSSDTFVSIVGVESLDFIRLHKKYSWKDEPSYKLDAIGEKYVGVNKIEYEGTLDDLFRDDIHKFIEYNFVDVKILKLLDEKLQYIALTQNISHKGKHNYSEVYQSSVTQDGAISAYLLSQGIVPPARDPNPFTKEGYAGGYLFCPKAGLYKYMFDEDLTSLYPSIIMTVNIGKETLIGRIVDADERNNRLGLNDLKEKDPDEIILIGKGTFESNGAENQTRIKVSQLLGMLEENDWTISANGVFFRTDKEAVLSTILKKWFKERVVYKNKMKKAYKSGDSEKGDHWYRMQYTMKILLNSLYGACAIKSFRYGSVILAEATTLTGQRIIQESALIANRHINSVIRGEKKLDL